MQNRQANFDEQHFAGEDVVVLNINQHIGGSGPEPGEGIHNGESNMQQPINADNQQVLDLNELD